MKEMMEMLNRAIKELTNEDVILLESIIFKEIMKRKAESLAKGK